MEVRWLWRATVWWFYEELGDCANFIHHWLVSSILYWLLRIYCDELWSNVHVLSSYLINSCHHRFSSFFDSPSIPLRLNHPQNTITFLLLRVRRINETMKEPKSRLELLVTTDEMKYSPLPLLNSWFFDYYRYFLTISSHKSGKHNACRTELF